MISTLLLSLLLSSTVLSTTTAQDSSEAAPPDPPCADGFIFQDDCYFVIEGKFRRNEADEACFNENAQLAYIKT